MADQTCTIGKHIVIRGNLSGAENLVIEGRVEGIIRLSNHLTVETTGVVEADMEVQDLTVNGVVHGDIQASQSIALNAGSKVAGNLRAPRIVIEDGARFKGRVDMNVDLPDGVQG